MTISDTLAAALATRLATIKVANGFNTDIGLRVFQGRRRLDESHIPCVVIVEGEDDPSEQQLGKIKNVARYAVEGVAACDPDNPNVAGRAIVADIKKAIWGADNKFGRTVIAMDYLGRTIAPREDGLDTVSAAVEFSLTYAENLAGS